MPSANNGDTTHKFTRLISYISPSKKYVYQCTCGRTAEGWNQSDAFTNHAKQLLADPFILADHEDNFGNENTETQL